MHLLISEFMEDLLNDVGRFYNNSVMCELAVFFWSLGFFKYIFIIIAGEMESFESGWTFQRQAKTRPHLDTRCVLIHHYIT